METLIFTDVSGDAFLKKCSEREDRLKSFLNVCWREIDNHIELPLLSQEEKEIPWRAKKIEKNLQALLLYLDYLVLELNKKKIEEYVLVKLKSGSRWMPFEPDALLLTFASYYGTVLTDIFWIHDLTVADVVHVSKRELDLSSLGKYITEQLNSINLLIHKNLILFKKHTVPIESINEAMSSEKNKLYKAFNLLMVTTAENIVRTFGSKLIEKQSLQRRNKSHSLEGFFTSVPWKDDLEVSLTKYLQVTGDYPVGEIEIYTTPVFPQPNRKISFKTRLAFLTRGFKEKRNAIAHGESVEYEDTVQALINAAALKEVLLTITEYEKVYHDL